MQPYNLSYSKSIQLMNTEQRRIKTEVEVEVHETLYTEALHLLLQTFSLIHSTPSPKDSLKFICR